MWRTFILDKSIPEPIPGSSEPRRYSFKKETGSIFGPLPKAWHIGKIKPSLYVQTRDKSAQFTHDQKPSDTIEHMDSQDLIRGEPRRVVFIAHGYNSDIRAKWMRDMCSAMLQNERTQTVVLVDWRDGSRILAYPQAAANAISVGLWLGQHMAQLLAEGVDVWGVGHSLGAHLMGASGRTAKEHGYTVRRITGLDPAGPAFQNNNQDKRLSASDAEFVDVIHTDGMGSPYFGTLVPLGTIDFYPNWGYKQAKNAKSLDYELDILQKCFQAYGGKNSTRYVGVVVDHSRAIDYFTWSIDNRNKFRTNLALTEEPGVRRPVHECRSVCCDVEMGYYADIPKRCYECDHYRGYYLKTNLIEPWK